jgi:hypothetical protein
VGGPYDHFKRKVNAFSPQAGILSDGRVVSSLVLAARTSVFFAPQNFVT